jgi:8-amino-7-oxononanoate synthase
LISGTKPQHLALEAELSDWLGAESCLLFSSGYAANVGVLSSLAAPGDTIFSDALNHASIVDGCRLGRGSVVVFPHRDLSALARALGRVQGDGVRWVVSESYFGMDGDSPDLRRLREVCDEQGAALIVDEAHALGVFGVQGRGLCAEAQVVPDVLVGGMGKAFGVHGGFVTCSALFREWFWNRARSFVFSTAPSPLLCGVALEHLEQLRAADAERRQLRRRERRLEERLVAGGVPLPPGRHGPVFPVVFGTESAVLQAAIELRELGVLCQPIRPPTVPSGGSRIRVTLRADMLEPTVDAMAEALITVWSSFARREQAGDEGIGSGGLSARGASGGVGRSGTVGGGPRSSEVEPHGEAARSERVEPGRVTGMPALPVTADAPAASPRGPVAAEVLEPPGLPQSSEGARMDGRVALSAPDARRTGRAAASPSGLLSELNASRWVILGTGTEVGKTFVAEALVRLLADQGRAVAGLKPIETGVQPGGLDGDARRLAEASFHVKQFPTPHPLYAFPDPLAPWLAARRQQHAIRLDALAPWIEQATAEGPEPLALVIETAGGVFSPLSRDTSNFDLALSLGAATWVLVAPDRLGVLHDVLSTLAAMQNLGRGPDWLVLSAPARADASTGSNAAELRHLGVRPPVLSLERGQVSPLKAILELETLERAGRRRPPPAPSGSS